MDVTNPYEENTPEWVLFHAVRREEEKEELEWKAMCHAVDEAERAHEEMLKAQATAISYRKALIKLTDDHAAITKEVE